MSTTKDNKKKIINLLHQLWGWFFSSKQNNFSKDKPHLLLKKHWTKIQFLLHKLKILKLDLTKEFFWKNTGLNWAEDVDDQGNLKEHVFVNVEFVKTQSIKIVNQLKSDSLKILILAKINQHWDSILPFLQDIHIFTPLNNLSILKDMNLDWNKDFDKNGRIKIKIQNNIIDDSKNKIFLAIYKVKPAFLLDILSQKIFNHWQLVESVFCQVKNVFSQLSDSTFWNLFDLKKEILTPDCKLKKECVLPLLKVRKFDLLTVKRITVFNLKKNVFQKILEAWKTIAPLVQKIKILNFSLDLKEDWVSADLKLVKDFDANGKFNNKVSEKIINNYTILKLLHIWQKLNFAFFTEFLQDQLLDYWKLLKPYVEKLFIVNSSFFQTKQWQKLQLDIKEDFNEHFFFKQSVVSQIHDWTPEKLQNIFNLNVQFLIKYITDEINIHWQQNRLILAKILILNKKEFIELPEWKAVGFKINIDLQSNCDFFSSTLQNIPNLSQECLLAIKKINATFLNFFFINALDKHWINLAPVFKAVKVKKYNFSGQDFWFLTNLSWETDLQEDGFLTEAAKKTVVNKTLQQITAIERLSAEKIKMFLDVVQEKKIEITQQKVNKQSESISFWERFKSFFGFESEVKRTLQDRLEKRINLNYFELHKDLFNYKTYKNRMKVLKWLQKKYSKRVINKLDIIATGEANVQPNRFIIELESVSKYFLTEKILNQVICKINLKVKRGDFVVVLGPSGAGKSTLLNLLSGISGTDGGDLFVNGVNLTLLNESGLTDFRRKYIGFVFQQYNLLENLTAKENVEIVGALLPVEKDPFDMKELLKLLEITTLVDKYPFQLSGGEQQRFAVARALAKNPDVLFCDEPTGALDQEMSRKVMQLLFEINQKYKTTVVLVTHNRIFAQIAKTVIYFVNGKITKFEENEKQIEPKNINFFY